MLLYNLKDDMNKTNPNYLAHPALDYLFHQVSVFKCILFFILTISSTTIMAQKEVLIYGGIRVNQFGGCSDEREQMINLFNSFGDNVTELMDDLDATWCADLPGKEVLVIPDLEGGDLVLSPAVLAKVQAFITGGGVVIVHGQFSDNDENFINQVLGSAIVPETTFGGNATLPPDLKI